MQPVLHKNGQYQQVNGMYQPYAGVLQGGPIPNAGGSSGKALRQSSLSGKHHQLASVYHNNGGVNSYNQLPIINTGATK